ncbi:poly(beta-D-mannuronate) lyase [Pseudoalteromonas shioyasakiensis]|uniref:poly(beta-D-mannuronate) lyase n=1 Tax=Pseudoalteromonas shioyasakiensis TaxID=1190813 RepID=UPI002117C78F|nr:poly(beta-D-mannuronate) lyase [Pseudoalteromonas shioyasakiensis]MCQ8879943.1 poly(beta-D-mannuronate) lyase [Pseudoalteromonas shioyasakiensis]
MKLKHFALCAIAAAIVGCNSDSKNEDNTLGSIALSGTAVMGETLNVSVSDPDGISGDVKYYWYADNEVIVGANSASFTLTDTQVGMSITAQASYTDDGGINESHVTDPTDDVAAVPFDATVLISGEALVGSTLTANVSDENGFDSETVVYEWYADNTLIEGEVQSELVLTEAQFGTMITVKALFEDARGFTESPTSAATSVVDRANSEGMVSISGAPAVGKTLTAVIEDVDGATGTINYQWFADAAALAGETASEFVVKQAQLGQVITVQVTYTDDNGFAEDNLSEPTQAVADEVVNIEGSISITGVTPHLNTGELTAELDEQNGVDETSITYTWLADGVEIAGTNSKTFTPTDYAGAAISVKAIYTDNDGFSETVIGELDSVVYSQIISDTTELSNALSSGLVEGSVLGLNSAVYSDLPEILITSALTIRAVEGESPIFSGESCIHVASGVDGAAISGITFKNLNTKADSFCENEEEAIVYSEGDNFVFSHNTMDGDVDVSELHEETHHWIVLKGKGALVERNTFSNRNNAVEGSVIKMASSSTDHTVQYNLFSNSDNPNFGESSLLLLNVGSTTGTDAADNSNFKIQYNRIDNFVTGRRLMRVQTSSATIQGNTIINANGGISLEDGGFNTVSDNIIIRTTDINNTSDRPSGVIMTPLGHTVTNNYIAGTRASNKEAGGIVFSANPFSQADGGLPNGGNQAVLDAAGDFTLNVSNNTVLNSIQPIVFSTEIGSRARVGDCDELTATDDPVLYGLTKNFFKISFDANLIANGVGEQDNEELALTQGYFLNHDYTSSPSAHAFEYDCDLINHEVSVFSNNYGFTDSYASGDVEDDYWVDFRKMNGNGEFDSDGAIDQNPAANDKEVPFLITAANGLTETDPEGAQAVAGAKGLHYIQASEVGAGSTWTAEQE